MAGMRDPALRILVLGSAAGGGFPQWNCSCPVCSLAWAGDPRVTPRTQSSLAVSADGECWALLNASPDIRKQIADSPELHPGGNGRHSPIRAVVLTNADVDHVAGLLSLRERQPFVVHCSAPIREALAANPIFGVLDPACVSIRDTPLDEAFEPVPDVTIVPFAVPGKVPLYQEAGTVDIGAETGVTVGLEIRAGGRRAIYVPGCAAVTPQLMDRLHGADVLFFDGTCHVDDEMVRLGLSTKTASRMGHLAMAGAAGSMAALAPARVGRRIFVHINNTNPVLVEGSPERRAAEAGGWEIGWDGMRVTYEETP
jgi:pyrroloquinoline quinone biosynthesis protein B